MLKLSFKELQGKKILIGMTGSIACYKIAKLTRYLINSGATVRIIMTKSSTKFITSLTMQTLSNNKVYTDKKNCRIDDNIEHIELSRNIDVIIIAPASMNFIAKLTHGIANDLLSNVCAARKCPLIIVPAMNYKMWTNVATQRNIKQLNKDGIEIFWPEYGQQACKEIGYGRMLDPIFIYENIVSFFTQKILSGNKVLVTAGPTFEPIDPIRGFTNRSSGKMGFAIARAAQHSGAITHIISGPVTLDTPLGVTRENIITANQMYNSVQKIIYNYNIFISVAAITDWRSANISKQKIKKFNKDSININLIKNPDILSSVTEMHKPPFCIGFAAESRRLRFYCKKKRIHKNVPILIGNIAPLTFGKNDNEIILFDEISEKKFQKENKQIIAKKIILEIAKRLEKN